MEVYARGSVLYWCSLSEEDANKVREYRKLNNCTLREAVENLYTNNQIALYDNCAETDYYTEEIEEVMDEDEDEEE